MYRYLVVFLDSGCTAAGTPETGAAGPVSRRVLVVGGGGGGQAGQVVHDSTLRTHPPEDTDQNNDDWARPLDPDVFLLTKSTNLWAIQYKTVQVQNTILVLLNTWQKYLLVFSSKQLLWSSFLLFFSQFTNARIGIPRYIRIHKKMDTSRFGTAHCTTWSRSATLHYNYRCVMSDTRQETDNHTGRVLN